MRGQIQAMPSFRGSHDEGSFAPERARRAHWPSGALCALWTRLALRAYLAIEAARAPLAWEALIALRALWAWWALETLLALESLCPHRALRAHLASLPRSAAAAAAIGEGTSG